MRSDKLLHKLLAASLTIGSLTFVPEFYNIPQVTSVSYAEVQTYTGVGEYIISKKETPEFGETNAKQYAERNALEQAGIFLSSNSTSINGKLTKDEIVTIAGGILNITDTKVEAFPLSDGYIKYRVTVTAQIDTEKLEEAMNKFLKRSYQARSVEVDQYEALKKLNDEQAQRIRELEEQIARASTIEQKEKVREEYNTIDKEALFIQKLETANKLRKEGKNKEAIQIYDEAIQLKQTEPSVYLGRACSYYNLKNYNQAIEDYNKAIQLNPNYAIAYYNRGWVYAKLQNYKQAIEDYTKAIQIDPNYAWAYNNRGLAYQALGDESKAQADFAKAKELGYKN